MRILQKGAPFRIKKIGVGVGGWGGGGRQIVIYENRGMQLLTVESGCFPDEVYANADGAIYANLPDTVKQHRNIT